MEMKLITRNFPNVGAIEGQLPEDTVDSLWKLIEESKKQPEDMKSELAGNISSSIRLDAKSPLIEDFVTNVIGSFIQQNIDSFGPPWRVTMKEGQGWNLESLWVPFYENDGERISISGNVTIGDTPV